MTDNTTTYNEHLWLPKDIWATIASFLDNDDLAKFRQLCSITQFIGSDVVILQPLYNHLYAIDNTLPPLLPQDGALAEFKKAFEKIQVSQQAEITHLTEQFPILMAEPEYVQVFQESTAVTLKALKAKHAVLNEINNKIITEQYFPNNPLTMLDVQGLGALQALCIMDLKVTNMYHDMPEGLAAFQKLCFEDNFLIDLNIPDVDADTKNEDEAFTPSAPAVIFSDFSSTESQKEEEPNNKRKRDENDTGENQHAAKRPRIGSSSSESQGE